MVGMAQIIHCEWKPSTWNNLDLRPVPAARPPDVGSMLEFRFMPSFCCNRMAVGCMETHKIEMYVTRVPVTKNISTSLIAQTSLK